jgi:hypothetical protein
LLCYPFSHSHCIDCISFHFCLPHTNLFPISYYHVEVGSRGNIFLEGQLVPFSGHAHDASFHVGKFRFVSCCCENRIEKQARYKSMRNILPVLLNVTQTTTFLPLQSALSSEEPEKSMGKKIFDTYVKVADIATTLFPVWTVLFTGIALKSPQSFAWFTTEYFTGALAALMLSMGITLTPQDFVKVAARPNATLMQFTLCYGMMPLLALALGTAFKLDPALMAGMVLVGSINGGQASNLCTYIARGNVALSVLMTTATTLGAIFMTPLLCKGLLGAVVPVDATGIAKSTIQVRYCILYTVCTVCCAAIFLFSDDWFLFYDCTPSPPAPTHLSVSSRVCVYDFNDERMSDLRE